MLFSYVTFVVVHPVVPQISYIPHYDGYAPSTYTRYTSLHVVVVVYPPRYRQSLREMSTASYIHAKAQKRRRPPLRWSGRRRGGRRVCRQDVVERGQSD